MKIYKMLGVDVFRKYFLFTYEKFLNLLHIDIGYRIGNVNYESLNRYKGNMRYFAIVHAVLLVALFVPALVNPVLFIAHVSLNTYCILVQRYNSIRINNLIKKTEPKYVKEKNDLTNEIKYYDKSLDKHEYVFVNRRGNEKKVDFDKLIDNSSIDNLRRYRKFLTEYKENSKKNSCKCTKNKKIMIKRYEVE